MAEEEKYFQRWQLERQLLTQRLTLFLITNSILFLGFAQIRATWFGIFIAMMGLVLCILGAINFKGISKRLDNFESKLEKQPDLAIKGFRVKGREMAMWFPLFFSIIWIVSLTFSFTLI